MSVMTSMYLLMSAMTLPSDSMSRYCSMYQSTIPYLLMMMYSSNYSYSSKTTMKSMWMLMSDSM